MQSEDRETRRMVDSINRVRHAVQGESAEQLVLSALHVACHGPRSERQHINRLAGRVDETLSAAGAASIAEAVLAATVRSAFAALHPAALAQTCQAVEEARASRVPQLRARDGGNHWRPE